jgi:ribosome-associated heat shock protein Hsp15
MARHPTKGVSQSSADPDRDGPPRAAGCEDGCIDGHQDPGATTRVDQWLWSVRAYATRSAAAAACRGGHVDVNGRTAKPATVIRAGDRVEATSARGRRILEVVRPIDKRVGVPIAATCFVDHTPPPPAEAEVDVFHRDRGAGRPTKRDRRRIDRLRGR